MRVTSTLTHVEEHLLREIVEIAGEVSPERRLSKANAAIKRDRKSTRLNSSH